MATITAAAGGGNWTVGATWVGGVAPTAADDAVLDATSGNVTIDAGAVARSLNCTGYTGTLTHNVCQLFLGDATAGAGNVVLSLSAAMTYTKTNTATSAIQFQSTSATQQSIETQGKVLGSCGIVSGNYYIVDALTSTGIITHTGGTFNTNTLPVSALQVSSTGGALRTWNMTNSTVTVSQNTGGAAWTTNGGNLTLTVTGSTLSLSSTSGWYIDPNGFALNSITSAAQTSLAAYMGIASTLTCVNLTVTSAAKVVSPLCFPGTTTISGTLTLTGNSDVNRVLVASSGLIGYLGTARTVTAAVVSLANVDFQDTIAAGASAPWTGTSLGNALGNSNITFTTPATQTRTGAGGNASTAASWTSRVPLPQDNVVIGAGASGTITMDMPRIGANVDFTGFAGTASFSVTNTTLYGSLTFASGMTVSGGFGMLFYGRGTHTITSNGKTIGGRIDIGAPGSTYSLTDALNAWQTWIGSDGFTNTTFNNGSFNITTQWLTVRGTATFGTSTVTLQQSSGQIYDGGSGATISAASATFVVSGASASTRQFTGGGKTYGTLTYTVAGSTGALVIIGANTFGTINFSDASNARTLTLPASTTTSITTGQFNVQGGSVGLMTVNSSTPGVTATLTRAGSTNTSDYLSLQDITATGGNWYAGAHSSIVSNVSGWIFQKLAAPGGGNWTTGATWVGGVAPTAADAVVFDSASGNVTINAGAVARALSATNYVGTLTHTAGVTLALGDATTAPGFSALRFGAGMTYVVTANSSVINFVSTNGSVQDIFTAGKLMTGVQFTGAGSNYRLADSFSSVSGAYGVSHQAGTLNLNNGTHSFGNFSTTGTPTLTMGSSSIAMIGSSIVNIVNITAGTVITANTATFTFSASSITGLSAAINLNGASIVFSSAVVNANLTGAMTVANITYNVNASKTSTLTLFGNPTVTGTFAVTGNTTINRPLIKSDTIGTARTITAAAVSFSNVDFQDIIAAGASAPWNDAYYTNKALNPRAISTGQLGEYLARWGWTRSFLTGQTTPIADVTTAMRLTVPGGGETSVNVRGFDAYYNPGLVTPGTTGDAILQPVTATQTYTLSIYVRSSVASTYYFRYRFHDGAGAWVGGGAVSGTAVSCPAATWTRISQTVTAPAGATHLAITVGNAAITTFPTSSTMDFTGLLIENSATVKTYFDGDSVDTYTNENTWTGTVHASTSIRIGQPLGNALGNTNIVFDTTTQTNTGATGNYSDITKWTSRVPLPQDTVVINTGSGTITMDMPRLGADVSFAGFVGTADFSSTTNTLYGSLTLGSGMTVTGTQTLVLSARSAKTITSNGKAFSHGAVVVDAAGGTYTLQDPLTLTPANTTSGLYMGRGTFNTNNQAVSIPAMYSDGANTRSLLLGTSTVTLTMTTASAYGNWLLSSTGMTLSAASATIVFGVASTQTRTFTGAGLTYGTLTYTVAGSTGSLTITGANTFEDINFSDASNARSLLFTPATNTTILGDFNVVGTAGKLMILDTSTGTGTFTLTKNAGYVAGDYLSITWSIATGGASWYAGANSVNGGSNTGWLFSAFVDDTPAGGGYPTEALIRQTAIELYIYDKTNVATLLDVVPERMTPSYLEELRGPGGGAFRISKSDPKLTANPNLLDYRNVVRVYLDGILRGAWIITKKSEVIIGSGELADQAYEVSGPGLRTWLADAVVYPLEPLGRLTKTSRTFSFASPRGNWYNTAEWLAPVAMNRQDAGRLLSASIVAQGIPIGGAAMRSAIAVELAIAAAAEAAASAAGTSSTYVMKSGASLPPSSAPDGKAKRTGGYVLAGSGGIYQLYGTVASPSQYWWDANGFHLILASINDAPATDPTTGATRYPTLQGPGYAVYVMVDPTTGVWDSSTSAANLARAHMTLFIRGEGFILTSTFEDEDGGTGEALTTSVAEIAPPGHTDVNPWRYGPKEWPTGFAPHARWIWSQESRSGISGGAVAPMGDVYFRREFTLAAAGRYSLSVAADNGYTAYLDGEVVIESQDVNSSSQALKVDLDLVTGDHILAIKVTNWEPGSAGLLCALLGYGNPSDPSPSSAVFVTDTSTSQGGQWLCDPYPAAVPGWTPGEVMLTLLAEAVARGVPTIALMVPTFSATQDTYGNAWDRSVDFSFDFGTEYSDVINKIEEIKADFFFEANIDGTVWMHAYTSRGIDKSVQNGNVQPVVFSPGHNVTSVNEDNEFSLVKNSLLTASKEGWFTPTESASQLIYGRVEGYLNVPGTAAMAAQVATATLTKLGLAQEAVTIGFEPFTDHIPWVNFGVGDLVKAPTTAPSGSGGVLVPRRVMSLSFSEDQATARVLYAAEFGTVNKDRVERIERWLKSVSEGTLGGSVANASGNSPGSLAVSAPGSLPALRDPVVVNPVLIGEVISGANIVPGSIVASDKMVANSITANSALIADAAINSAMIESLSANKITAGTIIAEIALAGRIATALSGARAEMDFAGFHAYNVNGEEVFRADNVGDVFLTGSVNTGSNNQPHIELADGLVTLDSVQGTVVSRDIYPRINFYTASFDEFKPAQLTTIDSRAEGLSPVTNFKASQYNSNDGSGRLAVPIMQMFAQADGSPSVSGFQYLFLNEGDGYSPNAFATGTFNLGNDLAVNVLRTIDAVTWPTLNQAPAFAIGSTATNTMRIGTKDIQAWLDSGTTYNTLELQPAGGRTLLNANGIAAHPTPSSTTHPFQIGSSAGLSLRFGQDRIIAATVTGPAFSTLVLNTDASSAGGDILMGWANNIVSIANGISLQFTSGLSRIQSTGGDAYLRLNWEAGRPCAIGGAATTTLIQEDCQVSDLMTILGTMTAGNQMHSTNAASASSCNCGGSQLDNQLSTAGGSVVGTAVIAAGNLEFDPPTAGGSANVNMVLLSGSIFRLRQTTSSLRYKENVREYTELTSDQILKLTPRIYQRNDEREMIGGDDEDDIWIGYREDNPWYVGFVAEEAHALGLHSFVAYDPHMPMDSPERVVSFEYDRFASLGHQIVLRDHQRRIMDLEQRIDALTKKEI